MKIDPSKLPRDIKQCHKIIISQADELDAKDRYVKRLLHMLAKMLR